MNKTRPKQLSFRVSEEEYQQLQEKELKRIGNNLNQIAKRCNEGGMLPSEAEVRKHGEELNKVWQSLRRYLQRRA